MMWGMIGFFNGIYALAAFIDAYCRAGWGECLMMKCDNPTGQVPPGMPGSAAYNLWIAILFIIGPIATLCPVYFCYRLYQDSNSGSDSGGGGVYQNYGGGRVG